MGEPSAAGQRRPDPEARALRTLLDESQYGLLLLDDHLRVVWVSRAGATWLRYEPAEIVGRQAEEFLDPIQSRGVLERVAEVLAGAFAGELGWQLGVRVRLVCGDGVSRDFEFGGWPVEGEREMVLVFQDVSDRARVEDVLTAVTEHDLEGALHRFLDLARSQLQAEVGIAMHPSLGGSSYLSPGADPALLDHVAEERDGAIVRAVEAGSGAVLGWLVVGRQHITPWGVETVERLASLLGIVLSHHVTLTDLVDAAATDPLTGLSNRRFLEFSLLAAEAGPPRGWALLYCDLDGFKAINDTRGHDVGDAVLRAVANRLTDAMRGDDVIARVGGDEFIVLAQADETQATHLERRIRDRLAPPIVDDTGAALDVGVSLGMATATTAQGVRHLLTEADHAMRRDKASRRGAPAR